MTEPNSPLPPPVPPEPEVAQKPETRLLGLTAKQWIVPGIVLFIVLSLMWGQIKSQNDELGSRPAPQQPAEQLAATSSCEVVVYEIDAVGAFDVTLSNETGGTEQFSDVGRWSKRYACWPPGDFAYVSAQLDGTGRVECTITRDGATVAHSKSSGEYVIATCSD